MNNNEFKNELEKFLSVDCPRYRERIYKIPYDISSRSNMSLDAKSDLYPYLIPLLLQSLSFANIEDTFWDYLKKTAKRLRPAIVPDASIPSFIKEHQSSDDFYLKKEFSIKFEKLVELSSKFLNEIEYPIKEDDFCDCSIALFLMAAHHFPSIYTDAESYENAIFQKLFNHAIFVEVEDSISFLNDDDQQKILDKFSYYKIKITL